MKLIAIGEPDTAECLALLDELRADIVRGHVHAFHAVGVTGEGRVEIYGGASKKTHKVAMIGALQYALMRYCQLLDD